MKKSITLTMGEWDALWEAAYNTLGLRSESIDEQGVRERVEFNVAVKAWNKVGAKVGYKQQDWYARGTNKEMHGI